VSAGLAPKSRWLPLAVVLCCAGAAVRAPAQEFSVLDGATNSIDSSLDLDEKSYAWKMEYRQGLGEHFEFSTSWLNEGHVTDHHRDGYSLQLWARESIFDRRLSLALGAGLFRYYDTVAANTADGYSDLHGFAGLLSADLAAYLSNRWIVRAEVNRSLAGAKSIDTWDFLVGFGYQLEPGRDAGPRPWPDHQTEKTTNSEVTLFVGESVVNSFDSPKSFASSLEYRRGLSRHFDVSASLLYEGDVNVLRRGGVIVQGWFGRPFLRDRLALSLGVGLYVAIEKHSAPTPGDGTLMLAGMVTPSVSYRFAEHWHARFSWNRSVTTDDSDTDVFQFGFGYRF
jgi:hypothetical protein